MPDVWVHSFLFQDVNDFDRRQSWIDSFTKEVMWQLETLSDLLCYGATA